MNIPKKLERKMSRINDSFDRMRGSGDMRKVKRYMNCFMSEYRRQRKLQKPGTLTTQRVLKYQKLLNVFRGWAFARV